MSLFETTDKTLLDQDTKFWLNTLTHLTDLYRTSELRDEESKALRAFACGRIAGVALAMCEHFSKGVDTLIGQDLDNPDVSATVAEGERLMNAGLRHTEKMNRRANEAKS